jgi:hypothetical protein
MYDRFPCITRSITSTHTPTNIIQSRRHLTTINLSVKILTNSNNLFGNPLHWTIFLCCTNTFHPSSKCDVTVRRTSTVFTWTRLGARVCFCVSLSPPSPRFDGIPSKHLGEVTVESDWNFEDCVWFLSCQLFGPVNHAELERLDWGPSLDFSLTVILPKTSLKDLILIILSTYQAW